MRLRVPFIALISSASCSSPSPVAPAPAAPTVRQPDFSGVWQGQWLVTTCSGDRHCFTYIGTNRSFTVRLDQVGDQVSGALTVGVIYRGTVLPGVTVDVSGTRIGNQVTLTGSKPAASRLDINGTVQVTRFALQLGPNDALTGTLEYVSQYTPDQNPMSSMVSWAGTIANATHMLIPPDAAQLFNGRWTGTYVIRACTAVGWLCGPNAVDATNSLDLSLTQAGGTVTGTLSKLPSAVTQLSVTGTASGNALALQGEGANAASEQVVRITAWSTARDDIGRLRGTFSYVVETHWAHGSHNGEIWTLAYDAELLDVALQP